MLPKTYVLYTFQTGGFCYQLLRRRKMRDSTHKCRYDATALFMSLFCEHFDFLNRFLLATASIPTLGPTQSPIQGYGGWSGSCV